MKSAARLFALAAALLASVPGVWGQTTGVVTTLYSFGALGTGQPPANADGANPLVGPLVQGTDGNFYGATSDGGVNGSGTIFKITATGALTTLYSFSALDGNGLNGDGADSYGGLIQAADGNFYGTAHSGGAYGHGTVFRLTPGGVFTTIHSFAGYPDDGGAPGAGLTQGSDGSLYGTTFSGGGDQFGIVFKLAADGTLTVLHSFEGGNSSEGVYPAGLTQGADGNLYGTTNDGGHIGIGTVYMITPAGVLTTLHQFTALSGGTSGTNGDGAVPTPELVQGSDGNFYGTTLRGGANGYGTVFKITPNGTLTTLDSFTADYENGGNPEGGLVLGRDDNFYGTVGDVAFQMTPGGTLTRLGTFGLSEGYPLAALVQGADGNFYGTTGGTVNGNGSVFALSIASGAATPTPTPGTPTPAPGSAPTATLLFPPDNLTVPIGVPLTLVASLSDPAGAAVSVQFVADATPIGAPISVAPGANYTASYTPPTTGFFEVSAVVTDNAGHQETTASVGLNIVAPPNGEAVGGITFLGGLDQRVLAAGSTVSLAAQLSAPSSAGVSSVTFYADNQPIAAFDGSGAPLTSGYAPGNRPVRRDASSGSAVYQSNYQLPGENKIINMIAKLLTNDGLSVSSAPVALTVKSAQKPPGITLDDPTANGGGSARVGQDVTVTAQAAVNGLPIARVQYYVGTQKVADVTNPTVYTFDYAPTATGNTVLTAVVTDTSGLSGGSPPLTLNVLPAAPTVSAAANGGGVVVEGAGKGIVVVTRTGDPSAALSVSYKVKGAAKAGVDYKPPTGTLVIPAGSTKAKIKLKTLAGGAFDGTRVAKVVLLPATDGSYVLGTPNVAKLKFISSN